MSRPASVTDLFLSLLEWYCSAADLTLDELIGQLANHFYLHGEEKKLRRLLLIDDPVQLEAEQALRSIVDELPNKFKISRNWTAVPGRDVDWSRTILASLSGRRGEYCSLLQCRSADTYLLQALSCLTSRWRRLLESVSSNKERRSRIQSLRNIESLLPVGQASWSLGIARQLSRVNKNATAAIEAALIQWEGEGSRGANLAAQFRKWLQSDHSMQLRAANEDNLFEWTIRLAIARTAVKAQKWHILPTRMAKEAKYGDILLRRGSWLLRISKGALRDGRGKSITSFFDDRYRQASIQMGGAATGLQPDVVLSFYSQDKPEKPVFFLADAKRNQEGDGRGYIGPSIAKAAAYIYAFDNNLLYAPRFTLFFWQGVKRILGTSIQSEIQDLDIEIIIREFESGAVMPEIFCFDIRMIGDDLRILSCWLDRLAGLASQGPFLATRDTSHSGTSQNP